MKTNELGIHSLLVFLFMLSGTSCYNIERTESEHRTIGIDIEKVRIKIEALNKQFSEDFRNKDSVAIADHYASDGTFGSVKGKDHLVSTWNKMIGNAFEEGTPNVIFITSSLASDDEYVVEIGVYQFADQDGNIKNQGKYGVVRKLENGEWKIYRDFGL